MVSQVGIRVREGNKHPYILNHDGLRPCPLAASTDAGRMVAPWVARVTGKNRQETYEAFRRGYW